MTDSGNLQPVACECMFSRYSKCLENFSFFIVDLGERKSLKYWISEVLFKLWGFLSFSKHYFAIAKKKIYIYIQNELPIPKLASMQTATIEGSLAIFINVLNF